MTDAEIVYTRMKEIASALEQRRTDDSRNLCKAFLAEISSGAEARKVAELLVKLSPKDADAYNCLGVVCFNNNDHIGALKAYSEALHINPENGAVILNYANLMYKRGDLKQAEKFFYESLKFLPERSHYMAYLNLANIFCDRKHFAEAKDMLEKAQVKSIKDAALCYMIANIYFSMEADNEAVIFYRRAAAAADTEMPYLYIFRIEEKNGEFAQAKEDIKKAYKIAERKYGSDFSLWPQKEKDYKDIFHMYHLYFNDAGKDPCIFRNVNFDSLIKENRNSELYHSLNAHQCIARLNDIYVVGNGWMLFKPDELYYNMSFAVSMILSEGNNEANFYKVESKRGVSYTKDWSNYETIDTPVIVMGGAKNYYHWMCDYLPRLALLEYAPKDIPVLINDNLTSFQKRSLELIGFDMSRLKYADINKIYRLKEAYILHFNDRPLLPHNTPDWMNPALSEYEVLWLRKTFAPYMKQKKGSPKRLFLSRKDAAFRICINEDEVFAAAKEFGFEKVENEKMPLEEQIALYSGVEAVMGVHGAGFTNMVFAPENATLIELHSKGELPGFYSNMARLTGQTHIAIDGTVTQTLRPLAQAFWNFEIDPEKVRAVLKERLG